MGKEIDAFKAERNLALVLVVTKLPNFVLALIAGIMSNSLIVWMEFVEITSIILPGILIAFISRRLSKNLKYRFNYGTGKVEAITAMSCEIFDITGLICIVLLSIRELFGMGEQDEYLLIAVILTIVGAVIDFIILRWQKKLLAQKHSKLLHTAFVSAEKEFCYDMVAVAVLLVSYLLMEQEWVEYLSPILCLILAGPFFFIVVHHLRESIKELIDLTLDEETQFKFLRVLTKYYDEYYGLGEVRSRQSGEFLFVDIELTFPPEKTFQEIRETVRKINEDIQKELDHCHVNIVISENPYVS